MIFFILTSLMIFLIVYVELPESCSVPWTWSDESIPKGMPYSERGTKQLNSLEEQFLKSIEEAILNMNITPIDFQKLRSTTPYVRTKTPVQITTIATTATFIRRKPRKGKRLLTDAEPKRVGLLDILELGKKEATSNKTKLEDVSLTSQENTTIDEKSAGVCHLDEITTSEPTTCIQVTFTFKQANAWFRKITGKSLLKGTSKNKSLSEGIMKLIKTRPTVYARRRGSFEDFKDFDRQDSTEDDDDEETSDTSSSTETEMEDDSSDFQTGSESVSKNARLRKKLFESYDLLHPRRRRNVFPSLERSVDVWEMMKDDSFIFPWLTSKEVKIMYGTTLEGEKYHVCFPWEIDKVGRENVEEVPDVSNPEWRQWLRIKKQESLERRLRENGTILSTCRKLKSWEHFIMDSSEQRDRLRRKYWRKKLRKRTTIRTIKTPRLFFKQWTKNSERFSYNEVWSKRTKRTAEYPPENLKPETNQLLENKIQEPLGPEKTMSESLMKEGPPPEHSALENPTPKPEPPLTEGQTWAIRSWTRKRIQIKKDEIPEAEPPNELEEPAEQWENTKPPAQSWTPKRDQGEIDEMPERNIPENYAPEIPMPKESALGRSAFEIAPQEDPGQRSPPKKIGPPNADEREQNMDYYPAEPESRTLASRTWVTRWPTRPGGGYTTWPNRKWGSRAWGYSTWPSRTWGDQYASRTWSSRTWGDRAQWGERTWPSRTWGGRTWPSRTWGDRQWPSRTWANQWPSRTWANQWSSRTWANQWPSRTWANQWSSRTWANQWPSRTWGNQWPSRTWGNRAQWGERTWPSRTWGDAQGRYHPWTSRSWTKAYGNWPPKTEPSDSQLRSDEKDEFYAEIERNPPAKRPAPASSKKQESAANEDDGWHLGNNRFVKVREFRGKLMVDIREFYDSNGELKPGKKGIALSATQWKKFRDLVNEIDDKLSQMA